MFCWTHYRNSVFRRAQRFQNTVIKKHFSTHAQNRCHFRFWAISTETTILIVFLGLEFFGPQKILAKTDRVHENARFANDSRESRCESPVPVSQVRQFLPNIRFFSISHFWITTLQQKIGFWGLVPFSFFLFVSLAATKRQNKNAQFFSKTSFLTPRQFCKNAILAQVDTIKCVLKHTK